MPRLHPLAPSFETPSPIVARRQVHGDIIHALVALPGGDRVWSASEDGRAILWSIPELQPLCEIEGPGPFNDLALDPRGEILVSAHDDGTARLWDATCGEPGPVLRGHGDFVRAVAIDGRWIATACEDGHVRLFDHEGRLVRTLGDGEGAWVSVLLHDGKVIAGRRDNRLVVWDAASGEERPPLYVAKTRIVGNRQWFLAIPSGEPHDGHRQTGPRALAIGPDGVLWSGSEDLLGWELARRERIAVRRAAWQVEDIVADEAGVVVAAHVVELWDRQGVHRQLPGPERGASAVVRAGDHLVVGGSKGELLILDPDVAEPVGRHADYVLGLEVDPVARLAATGDSVGTVRVWDLEDGRMLACLDRWPEPNDHPFVFTGDGRLVTSRGDGEPVLTIWDPRSGEVLRELEGPSDRSELGGVRGLTMVTPGVLLSGGHPGITRWDLASGHHDRLAGRTQQVSRLVPDPSGRFVATLGWFSAGVLRGEESDIMRTQEHLQIWSIERGVLLHTYAGRFPEGERFGLDFGAPVAVEGGWISRSGARAGELARWEPAREGPVATLDLGGSISELGPAGADLFALHRPPGAAAEEGDEDEGPSDLLTLVDADLRPLGSFEMPLRARHVAADDARIAATDLDGRLVLLDRQGALLAELDLRGAAYRLALAGDRIVVGMADGRVHVLAIRG